MLKDRIEDFISDMVINSNNINDKYYQNFIIIFDKWFQSSEFDVDTSYILSQTLKFFDDSITDFSVIYNFYLINYIRSIDKVENISFIVLKSNFITDTTSNNLSESIRNFCEYLYDWIQESSFEVDNNIINIL